ncbi:DNA/RNA non-specific endonuclease [Rubricoccus marinus]|uniref:Type VII secretion system protein EssD-like domain-containing protein n=1 Tax=Rubricoccus marinus TaxID=716817 RepID=A0A259TVK6_9BACT|nr:DNA/RNA non-specific endonuclease [Rubricoccus marinus]OZC01730.1 hypothetical protein BSZ36_01255 [Rubricoccus marinus]
MRFALPWRAALGALVLAFSLAACDATQPASGDGVAPVASDPVYEAMLDGVGGLDGLAALLDSASPEALEATFAEYGVDYEQIDVSTADMAEAKLGDTITECPQYFRSADRNKWITLVGAGGSESHYIDGTGRPLAAYKRLPPVTTAARSTYCQTNVGNWGSPASSFDGGHLIGSQLGGWGKRANIVPQHYNFNRGNWKRVEDQLAKCDRLSNGVVAYYVVVGYPSGSGLTPSTFTANVSVSNSAWENAYFSNASGGGSNGTAEATSMQNWLSGRGCY